MRITYSRLDEAVFAKGQLDSGVFGEGEWKSTIAAAFAQQVRSKSCAALSGLQLESQEKESDIDADETGFHDNVEDDSTATCTRQQHVLAGSRRKSCCACDTTTSGCLSFSTAENSYLRLHHSHRKLHVQTQFYESSAIHQ